MKARQPFAALSVSGITKAELKCLFRSVLPWQIKIFLCDHRQRKIDDAIVLELAG